MTTIQTTPRGPATSAADDTVASGLWTAARDETHAGSWAEAVRLAGIDDPRGRLLSIRVEATLRQADHVRSLTSEATAKADARATDAVEARDDAVRTLDAWFARSALVQGETGAAIRAAASGYLRTCRVGGMSTRDSDRVVGAIDGMIEQGLFADVLLRVLAVPHATEATLPTPPKPLRRHEALLRLMDECRTANADLDPEDARSVAAAAVRAEALGVLEASRHPFAVSDDVARVRAIAQAVAVARTAPDGLDGTHAVMRGLVTAVRANQPEATAEAEPASPAGPGGP